MKKLLILASAVALSMAMPALASAEAPPVDNCGQLCNPYPPGTPGTPTPAPCSGCYCPGTGEAPASTHYGNIRPCAR